MKIIVESAVNIAHILLGKYDRSQVTSELISEEIENIFRMNGFDRSIEEELIARLEADFKVSVGAATELVDNSVKPWLKDVKAGLEWELWERYRKYMRAKNSSFPIDSLDDLTDRILDKAVNPMEPGPWDRRGMVVGNVQSGKTANYIGLINKATDAGYKLIIIISGIHNTLRSQTQKRVDEGYIGRNSADFIFRRQNRTVGVGEYSTRTEIFSYTSSEEKGDFNRRVASGLNVPIGGQSPTVLVIKKNKSILENLIVWLAGFAVEDPDGELRITDVPIMVIDDEADNASVNSGSKVDVRTINRLIRTLLNLFTKNTFIGYTATPYANLFIPSDWCRELEASVGNERFKIGEDLFPRDFIINIPAPSNYLGPVQVFGFENNLTGEATEGLEVIRYVTDQEPHFPRIVNRQNKGMLPEQIPFSLREAIKSFILVCAVRRVRGDEKKHNSMLVHVARLVAWIDRIAWHVNETLRDFQRQIKSGQGPLLDELRELYESDFIPTTEEVKQNLTYPDSKITIHRWEEIKPELIEAVTKIDVRAVHGQKNTRSLEFHNIGELNYDSYENGLSVIAVGGNKLSRGITMEGLSVSYFLRTTRMYDSLMQMGRWFGYKPGFADLCRLYTTVDLASWYEHITMATEEMRADFDYLASKNMRPEDYRLKVRTHPGMLLITSVAKMKDFETLTVSFSGKLIQTYEFLKTQRVVENNNNAFNNLLAKMAYPEKLITNTGRLNGLLWKDIGSEFVLEFVESYEDEIIRNDVIASYIQTQNGKGNLAKWSVGVILNSNNTHTTEGVLKGETVIRHDFFINGERIEGGLPGRNLVEAGGAKLKVKGRKNAILDKRARMIDLNLENNSPEDDIKTERKRLGRPLLVIMPLDPRVLGENLSQVPLIGYGLIFPEFEGEEQCEYAVRLLGEDFDDELQEADEDQDEE